MAYTPLPREWLLSIYQHITGFLRWLSAKESTCQCRRHRLDPWVRKIPWRRKWQPTLVFLPGNPMDSGAWLATVRRVVKSQDRTEPLRPQIHTQRATPCHPRGHPGLCRAESLSHVQLFATPGTIAHQAPVAMGIGSLFPKCLIVFKFKGLVFPYILRITSYLITILIYKYLQILFSYYKYLQIFIPPLRVLINISCLSLRTLNIYKNLNCIYKVNHICVKYLNGLITNKKSQVTK